MSYESKRKEVFDVLSQAHKALNRGGVELIREHERTGETLLSDEQVMVVGDFQNEVHEKDDQLTMFLVLDALDFLYQVYRDQLRDVTLSYLKAATEAGWGPAMLKIGVGHISDCFSVPEQYAWVKLSGDSSGEIEAFNDLTEDEVQEGDRIASALSAEFEKKGVVVHGWSELYG